LSGRRNSRPEDRSDGYSSPVATARHGWKLVREGNAIKLWGRLARF
jgi:hypothetical protein